MKLKLLPKLVVTAVILAALIGGWLFFVKGYVIFRRHGAVPADLIYKASIPGMPKIRTMLDPLEMTDFDLTRQLARSGLVPAKIAGPEVNILVVSGGGANGAYAAGVLCGWSETGKRPEFNIVTGVSTGALIAPAAFLGPKYDHILSDIYTKVSDKSIMAQNLGEFLLGGRPSLMDTEPLKRILKQNVTPEIFHAVAREHAKGRRLYIATTDLDAKRFVMWDMGAIASVGSPEALKLFRSVMLASAAIPVAFPPVMIEVEAGGALYDEMHADGSVVTQMFGAMLIAGHKDIKSAKVTIYAIRNGKFADVPEYVSPKMQDIAGTSFAMLLNSQSNGDFYRFASIARDNGFEFNLACIPYKFNEPRTGEFDTAYMNKLFKLGFDTASKNTADLWVRHVDADGAMRSSGD